ncbi:SprT-like domain-containing protein [uncultured Oscillibacter sp.]|jgi:hypothetical protein|uniref:SprT-like domain-containing protein n=1 Tax=uncultured Oscillibacter sp. TaxID=876091 RepID=UPI00260185F0|nr:SprT-like domain-containing protein [uncultured Oscillibacter sp.]
MKEIVKTSRLAGQLEKLFNKLNSDFFNGELQTPVITIQSTPRAYGHYSTYDAWNVKGEGRREINIGAGTLDRPIEYTAATMLHEMCHMYNDTVLHIQDCSRGGTYHNKRFKQTAEAHGLVCSKTNRYGWSDTASELSDTLLEWVLNNNIQEICLNRNESSGIRISGGAKAANGTGSTGTEDKPKVKSSRKYVCPCCGTIIRATREVNVICGDCNVEFEWAK